MSGDEFDDIAARLKAEGAQPDPEMEGAAMAAKQVGMFFHVLKQFQIPDAQAEWLTKSWMELGMEDRDQ